MSTQAQTQPKTTPAAQCDAPPINFFNGETMQKMRQAADNWLNIVCDAAGIPPSEAGNLSETIPQEVLCSFVASAVANSAFIVTFPRTPRQRLQVSVLRDDAFPLCYKEQPAEAIRELSQHVSIEYMFQLAAEIKKRAKRRLAWQNSKPKKGKPRLP